MNETTAVELVKKEVVVTKEASELSDSLVGLVKSGKTALDDGFQAGTDIPVILTENLTGLMNGLGGMEKLGAEAKENKAEFIRAWMLGGLEIADLFFD